MLNQPQFQVQVLGGSSEENQQMCMAVHSAMENYGFKNIQCDAQPLMFQESALLARIRNVNPDLFDNTVAISGMCEYDIQGSVPTSNPTTSPDNPPFGNFTPTRWSQF